MEDDEADAGQPQRWLVMGLPTKVNQKSWTTNNWVVMVVEELVEGWGNCLKTPQGKEKKLIKTK